MENAGGTHFCVGYDENFLVERGLIWKGGHLPYNPELKERAREMRKNMTLAEKKLWKEFLQKYEYKVLRQKPIDNYIVDFYIPEKMCVIEVDGEIHGREENKKYDKIRTQLLEKYGIRVLRYNNQQIMTDFTNTINHIKTHISIFPSLEKRN